MDSVSSLITCLAFHKVLFLLLKHSWIIRTYIEYKYSLGFHMGRSVWHSPGADASSNFYFY